MRNYIQDLVACNIANWYHSFEKHTFRTVLLPLSPELSSWLVEDGIVLPENSTAVSEKKERQYQSLCFSYSIFSSAENGESVLTNS